MFKSNEELSMGKSGVGCENAISYESSKFGEVIYENDNSLIFHAIEKNIITSRTFHRLTMYDKEDKTVSEDIHIGNSEFDKEMLKLLDYGVVVEPMVLADIRRKAIKYKGYRCYSTGGYLGWHKNKDEKEFYLGAEIVADRHYPMASYGDHLLSGGSLTTWIANCNEFITNKEIAQMVIAAGFSAEVVGFLQSGVIILNLCGSSSIGKSTASDFVTSIYSKPRDIRIYSTFDSTENNLKSIARNNYGVAVVIDDTSTSKENSFQTLIYGLGNGISRGRLLTNGERQETYKWFTSFITSSEQSMYENTDVKQGMIRRLIELKVESGDLTENAQHANHIREIVEENYGLAGVEFARYLRKQGKQKVKTLVKEKQEMIMERTSSDSVSQAKADQYGIIITTAELLKESLNLEFDTEKLLDYILKQIGEIREQEVTREKHPVASVYEYLCKFARDKIEKKELRINEDGYIDIPRATFAKIIGKMGWNFDEIIEIFNTKNFAEPDENRKYHMKGNQPFVRLYVGHEGEEE